MFIKMGSTGPTVRDIQATLNVAVPFPPLLIVDGIFGPKTHQRVVTFQQKAGLIADGIVGPLTSKVLVGQVIAVLKG